MWWPSHWYWECRPTLVSFHQCGFFSSQSLIQTPIITLGLGLHLDHGEVPNATNLILSMRQHQVKTTRAKNSHDEDQTKVLETDVQPLDGSKWEATELVWEAEHCRIVGKSTEQSDDDEDDE